MAALRIIARLDIKSPNLIKGIHLEGLRVMGPPQPFAQRYYEAGIDELIYMDIVASLYGRNNLVELVRKTARNVFVPMTVGGGVRSIEDVRELLRAGADKVAINTAATKRPELITEVARRFGSQCMVLSIEAKRVRPDVWEAFTDNGREYTGRDVMEWVKEGVERGAGEILLTSVDQEGTRKGYDLELVRRVADAVPIPVIASGGLGDPQHLVDVVREGHADAVAIADALHYKRHTLDEFRTAAQAAGIPVRLAK
jgi:cyclase